MEEKSLPLSGEMLVKAQVLAEEINVTFPHQPVPEGDHIARPGIWFDEQGIMHRYENPEAASVAAFLSGRRWDDLVGVPLITWNEAYSSLIFVTNEASAYYIPAFMLTAVYSYHEAQTLVEGLILNKLSHPSIRKEVLTQALARLAAEIPEALQPRYRSVAQQEALEVQQVQEFEEFVTVLSLAQQRTVKHFLHFMAETYPEVHDDAIRALNGHWGMISG